MNKNKPSDSFWTRDKPNGIAETIRRLRRKLKLERQEWEKLKQEQMEDDDNDENFSGIY